MESTAQTIKRPVTQAAAQSAKPLFTNRGLVRLMVPLVIEQLLLMTVGMADTMMVTTAGEAVVSGVSLVDSINILIINIFSALSTGGAVVVAQYRPSSCSTWPCWCP